MNIYEPAKTHDTIRSNAHIVLSLIMLVSYERRTNDRQVITKRALLL